MKKEIASIILIVIMGISLITLADAFINIIQREPTKTAAIVITYTIIFIIAVLTLLTAIAIILK